MINTFCTAKELYSSRHALAPLLARYETATPKHRVSQGMIHLQSRTGAALQKKLYSMLAPLARQTARLGTADETAFLF